MKRVTKTAMFAVGMLTACGGPADLDSGADPIPAMEGHGDEQPDEQADPVDFDRNALHPRGQNRMQRGQLDVVPSISPASAVIKPWESLQLTVENGRSTGTFQLREIYGGLVTPEGLFFPSSSGVYHIEYVDGRHTAIATVRVQRELDIGFPGAVGMAIDGRTMFLSFMTGCIRAIDLVDRTAKTVAGECRANNNSSGTDDAVRDGIGTDARFAMPRALAVDAKARKLYISDWSSLRAYDLETREVTTVEGSLAMQLCPSLLFHEGTLYCSDPFSDEIRRMDLSSGAVMTWNIEAGIDFASTLAVDTNGDILVADQDTSTIFAFAGDASNLRALPFDLGAYPSRYEGGPLGLHVNAIATKDGDIYFKSTSGQLYRIRRATNAVEFLGESIWPSYSWAMAFGTNGKLYSISYASLEVWDPSNETLQNLRLVDLDAEAATSD